MKKLILIVALFFGFSAIGQNNVPAADIIYKTITPVPLASAPLAPRIHQRYLKTDGNFYKWNGASWVLDNSSGNDFPTAAVLTGDLLTITIPNQSDVVVDLSVFKDDTDNQTITDFSLVGTLLSITLSDGNTATQDLSSLGGGNVDSVNGLSGIVTLDTDDIPEGTSLYYTEARVSANSSVVANTAKNSYPSNDAGKVANLPADQNSINSDIEARTLANDNKVSADGSVSDHSDVNTTGVADGDVLKWSSANSRFEPMTDNTGGGSGTDDQTASEVPVVDSGNNFTATNVEAAFAEIYPQIPQDAAQLATNPSGASVNNQPDVQASLEDLNTRMEAEEAEGGGGSSPFVEASNVIQPTNLATARVNIGGTGGFAWLNIVNPSNGRRTEVNQGEVASKNSDGSLRGFVFRTTAFQNLTSNASASWEAINESFVRIPQEFKATAFTFIEGDLTIPAQTYNAGTADGSNLAATQDYVYDAVQAGGGGSSADINKPMRRVKTANGDLSDSDIYDSSTGRKAEVHFGADNLTVEIDSTLGNVGDRMAVYANLYSGGVLKRKATNPMTILYKDGTSQKQADSIIFSGGDVGSFKKLRDSVLFYTGDASPVELVVVPQCTADANEQHTDANAASDPNCNESNTANGWTSNVGALNTSPDSTQGAHSIQITNTADVVMYARKTFIAANGDTFDLTLDVKAVQTPNVGVYISITNQTGHSAQYYTSSNNWVSTGTISFTATGNFEVQIYSHLGNGDANDETRFDNFSLRKTN